MCRRARWNRNFFLETPRNKFLLHDAEELHAVHMEYQRREKEKQGATSYEEDRESLHGHEAFSDGHFAMCKVVLQVEHDVEETLENFRFGEERSHAAGDGDFGAEKAADSSDAGERMMEVHGDEETKGE